MADSGGGGEGRGENFVNSGGDVEGVQDVNDNTKINDSRASKGASRFKVARVDFEQSADEQNPEPPSHEESVEESVPTVAFHIGDEMTAPGSPNPGDTHHASYDTHNQRTFAHNTIETLPHLDHYRNLLSATGAMRQRPTLLELHEIEVRE